MHTLLPLAIVDLETTGTHAGADAITEIGIVRLDPTGDGEVRVTEWSSLVRPGVPIPPAIQALTGITDAMVAEAANTLADFTIERFPGEIYPPVEALHEASVRVAVRVAARAVKDGVARVKDQALDVEALAMALRARAPQYMVPARFVWLDAMPLTPSGKRADAVLQARPLPSLMTCHETVAPRNDRERMRERDVSTSNGGTRRPARNVRYGWSVTT